MPDNTAQIVVPDRPQTPAQGFWDSWTPSALISLAVVLAGLTGWIWKLRHDVDRMDKERVKETTRNDALEARVHYLEKLAERHDERSDEQGRRMSRIEDKIDDFGKDLRQLIVSLTPKK